MLLSVNKLDNFPQSEIAELTERCMELQELATASKRLKDEVDELKYRLTNTGKVFFVTRFSLQTYYSNMLDLL